MKKLFLLLLFLVYGISAFSQRSWSYSVWFGLADKQGNTITEEDFLQRGKVELYSSFTSNSDVECDTASLFGAISFKFNQTTTESTNQLAFVYNGDTTVLHIPTYKPHLNLGTIVLSGGSYNLLNADSVFKCHRFNADYSSTYMCQLKHGLEYFRADERVYFPDLFFAGIVCPRKYYKLYDHHKNTDFNYSAIKDSLNLYPKGLKMLDGVFNILNGDYEVYRFISYQRKDIFSDIDTLVDYYSMIILKVDKNKIVDGFQYDLSNPEQPGDCKLYQITSQVIKKEKILIRSLGFKREDEFIFGSCDGISDRFLRDKGILDFDR